VVNFIPDAFHILSTSTLLLFLLHNISKQAIASQIIDKAAHTIHKSGAQ